MIVTPSLFVKTSRRATGLYRWRRLFSLGSLHSPYCHIQYFRHSSNRFKDLLLESLTLVDVAYLINGVAYLINGSRRWLSLLQIVLEFLFLSKTLFLFSLPQLYLDAFNFNYCADCKWKCGYFIVTLFQVFKNNLSHHQNL